MKLRNYNVPAELNKTRTIQIRGLLVRAALSPFDFPNDAEAGFDEGAHEFMLKLNYLGPHEAEVFYTERKGVALYVGKRTKRLFRVVVKGVEDKSQIPRIAIEAIMQISEKIKDSEDGYPYMEQLNYQAAMEFLEQEGPHMVA